MEHLTFTELCHKAGITETDANVYGLCRCEIEKLILNQSKKNNHMKPTNETPLSPEMCILLVIILLTIFNLK